MKIFFLLPLILLLAGATYVSWRIWHILPLAISLRWGAVALFWICFAVMVSNFFVLDRIPLNVATILYEIGYSWIFVLLYLFMTFILLDTGKLIHLVPHSFLNSSLWGTLSVAFVLVAVFVYGNINYYDKARVNIEEKTSKKLSKPVKMVMVSDLHLGYHNRRNEFRKWVDLINNEKPDIILIAGDIIDNSTRPLVEEGIAEEFHRFNAPVYACTGNHEFISGEENAQKFLSTTGITLLRDSVVTIGDLCIIGRDDRSNRHRTALGKLMKQADTGKYTILLDHQPYHLEQAERAGIDFQFSGHTHHGQVFPINYITDAIYEDAFGPWRRGNTHYYVSSGIGIWGGKFRIGTRSEYVVMTVSND